MSVETPAAGKLSTWFIGLFSFLVAMGGFWAASHTESETIYLASMVVGVGGIAGIFFLIKRSFDAPHHP